MGENVVFYIAIFVIYDIRPHFRIWKHLIQKASQYDGKYDQLSILIIKNAYWNYEMFETFESRIVNWNNILNLHILQMCNVCHGCR